VRSLHGQSFYVPVCSCLAGARTSYAPPRTAGYAANERTKGSRLQASKGQQRGVVILPGLGNNAADYDAISADLKVASLKLLINMHDLAGKLPPNK
jgi:hypothetical protein